MLLPDPDTWCYSPLLHCLPASLSQSAYCTRASSDSHLVVIPGTTEPTRQAASETLSDDGELDEAELHIELSDLRSRTAVLMDAAELFRQAQSSVSRAREAKSFRREESHESDDHSPRIAHTLTACCRCRQVCNNDFNLSLRKADLPCRGRRDAIPTFPNAFHARGPVPFASISIQPKGRKYLGHML